MLRRERDTGQTGVVTQQSTKHMNQRDITDAINRLNPSQDAIELSINFKNLINKDSGIGGNVSDPFCVVYVKTGENWVEVGRTEIIANHLNGEFVTKITVPYQFEVDRRLKFVLYDCDTSFKTNDSTGMVLTEQDFLGEAECLLSQIVGMHTHTMKLQRVETGEITVSMMPKPKNNDVLTIQPGFSGLCIGAFTFFGCCMSGASVFLTISIYHESRYIPVYKGPYTVTSGTGTFPAFSIEVSKLGPIDIPMRFEISRFDDPGHTLLGYTDITLEQLMSNDQFVLSNQELARRGKKNIGHLIVDASHKKITFQPTFLGYVNSGVEVQCQFVVDYTSSNGAYDKPGTLHNLHPVPYGHGQIITSEYLEAIRALYPLVGGYDHDGLIPLFGFGAVIPVSETRRELSFDFPINGDPENPSVLGMDGVVTAYTNILPNIQFSGPTNLAPIINRIIRDKTEQLKTSVSFDIVIILTDGAITDMRDTIDALVRASCLPIGFLIVGIGNGDFTNMHILDADESKLRSHTGQVARRDNVQFVEFNAHRHDLAKFTKESLAEIPAQLVDSMMILGKMPSDFVKPESSEHSSTQSSTQSSAQSSTQSSAQSAGAGNSTNTVQVELVSTKSVRLDLPPSYTESTRDLSQ